MIEVREGLDREGWYVVQGGGRSAATLQLLAEALGVPESELRLMPKRLTQHKRSAARLNGHTEIVRRNEFDLF